VLGQRDRADRPARLRLADRHSGPAGGRTPEVLVERDDAVDFGHGEVQYVGDDRDVALVDVLQLLLNRVQNRDQRTPEPT
jgi:hypothetical protein